MPLLKRRIAEYFLAEIFISIVAAGLCTGVVVDTQRAESIIAFISLIIVAFYNIRCLMAYMVFVKSYRVYLRVNLSALLLFALVSTVLMSFNLDTVQTIFLFPYRMFTLMGINPVVSALYVNGIMFLLTLIVPFIIPAKR